MRDNLIRALFCILAVSVGPAAAQSGIDGATVYRQRCQMCHGTRERPSPLAPDLTGVVGRKAALAKFAYSPALTKSGLVWTRPNLDRYLTGPSKMVPGTKMVVSLQNADQRSALIGYLAGKR